MAGTVLHEFVSKHAQRATGDVVDARGNTGVWAVVDSAVTQDTGMRVMAGAPKNALLAAANRRFSEDITLLAGFAVMLFLVVWFFAELSLRRQIARITRMARQLAEGNRAARIAPPLPRGVNWVS